MNTATPTPPQRERQQLLALRAAVEQRVPTRSVVATCSQAWNCGASLVRDRLAVVRRLLRMVARHAAQQEEAALPRPVPAVPPQPAQDEPSSLTARFARLLRPCPAPETLACSLGEMAPTIPCAEHGDETRAGACPPRAPEVDRAASILLPCPLPGTTHSRDPPGGLPWRLAPATRTMRPRRRVEVRAA